MESAWGANIIAHGARQGTVSACAGPARKRCMLQTQSADDPPAIYKQQPPHHCQACCTISPYCIAVPPPSHPGVTHLSMALRTSLATRVASGISSTGASGPASAGPVPWRITLKEASGLCPPRRLNMGVSRARQRAGWKRARGLP